MSVNLHQLTPISMAHSTTVLQQLQHLLPMSDFDRFVGQQKADRYVKKLTCRNQLCILLYAQATGKDSLRGIETGLKMRDSKWYHLGLTTVAKTTLATANEKRPWQIYESLFYTLLGNCKELHSGTASEFSFKNSLYALDATVIDVCLSIFPWATFRKRKGAFKLHAVLNAQSQIPELIIMTNGKTHDGKVAHEIDFSTFPPGSIFMMDRAYLDYALLWKIKKAGHHFVIRTKKSTHLLHLKEHRPAVGKGVLKDEKVSFVLDQAQQDYPEDLRLVTFYDEEHKVTYEFLTDEHRLSAANIAEIYKQRWRVELFFKWIKQHLQIKTFLGTSKNAVMTQIWVAMIYYLLVAWIKFQTTFKGSLLELTRMLQEVLLEHVALIQILRLSENTISKAIARGSPQLTLC